MSCQHVSSICSANVNHLFMSCQISKAVFSRVELHVSCAEPGKIATSSGVSGHHLCYGNGDDRVLRLWAGTIVLFCSLHVHLKSKDFGHVQNIFHVQLKLNVRANPEIVFINRLGPKTCWEDTHDREANKTAQTRSLWVTCISKCYHVCIVQSPPGTPAVCVIAPGHLAGCG
jgi:hypothetical protein